MNKLTALSSLPAMMLHVVPLPRLPSQQLKHIGGGDTGNPPRIMSSALQAAVNSSAVEGQVLMHHTLVLGSAIASIGSLHTLRPQCVRPWFGAHMTLVRSRLWSLNLVHLEALKKQQPVSIGTTPCLCLLHPTVGLDVCQKQVLGFALQSGLVLLLPALLVPAGCFTPNLPWPFTCFRPLAGAFVGRFGAASALEDDHRLRSTSLAVHWWSPAAGSMDSSLLECCDMMHHFITLQSRM